MKAIASFLLATAALEAVVVASGYALDPASALAILFAAGITGGFVADYGRSVRRPLDPVRRAVVAPMPAVRRPATGEVMASVIIFNTHVA